MKEQKSLNQQENEQPEEQFNIHRTLRWKTYKAVVAVSVGFSAEFVANHFHIPAEGAVSLGSAAGLITAAILFNKNLEK